MFLTFQPRGKQLLADGASVLWDAHFFERDAHNKRFWLFAFTNGVKVWMAAAIWNELCRSRKRQPFPVGAELFTTEVPPLDNLICPGRTCSGKLTREQEQERDALTGFGFTLRS
jgi:hypothetical protein